MTDDALDAAQPDPDDEPFTPEELAELTAAGIDPATAYRIAGKIFTRREGIGTEVRFAGDGDGPERTVVVPTDFMPGATEDDVKRAAAQHLHDLDALQERLTADHVDRAIADLEAAGMFRAVVDMAARIIRDGVSVFLTNAPDDPDSPLPHDIADLTDDERRTVAETVAGLEAAGTHRDLSTMAAAVSVALTDDPDSPLPDDLTDDERRQIVERCTDALHEEMAGVLADVALTGDNAPAFKRDFARHLLAESWAWALQDAREIADELEAMPGDNDEAMPPEAFAELHERVYYEGTYWTRALLDFAPRAAGELAEMVARALAETPDLGRDMARAALRAIRGEGDDKPGRRKRMAPKAPLMRPGFDGIDAAGRVWGHVPNDRITHGLTVALQQAVDEGWPASPDGRPYTTVAGRGWSVTYSLAPEDFPTIDATWETMRDLDDDTADTAMVALAHWLANYQRDPVTKLAAITPNDILAQRGTPKHHKGGYRATDKHAVARQMNALGSIWIEGRGFETTETDPKGKKRRTMTTPEGRFLIITTREKQTALTPHTETLYTRFYYRPGDWAYVFMQDGRGAGELARMMQAVLAYDSKRDRYPKRMGRYLTWQFRLRAFARTWHQPYTMKALLDDAGLSPKQSDYDNPQRFRRAIEQALNDLRNAHVIGSWEYRELGGLPKRNWFPLWLAATLVIEPPQDLRDAYASIGTRRKALRALSKSAPKAAS